MYCQSYMEKIFFDFDIGDEIHFVYEDGEQNIFVFERIIYIYLDKTIFTILQKRICYMGKSAINKQFKILQ